jgi:hypothetical protein
MAFLLLRLRADNVLRIGKSTVASARVMCPYLPALATSHAGQMPPATAVSAAPPSLQNAQRITRTARTVATLIRLSVPIQHAAETFEMFARSNTSTDP